MNDNDENDEQPPSTSSTPTRALLKIGGEVVANRPALRQLLSEVAELSAQGWQFVVVHGAGPQAGELQTRLGLPSRKVAGRRVTDAATLQIVKQVLGGEVNLDVVATAVGQGVKAVGISGCAAGLVRAAKLASIEEDGELVDFGFVGEVDRVDPGILLHLWAGGFTPVVNPLSLSTTIDDADGSAQIYNVNADTAASSIAAALRVDHLFLVTSVPGVLRDKDDPATRIARLTVSEARRAIAQGIIVGGMIPKVEDALPHLGQTIGAVHILGASALRDEAQQPGRHGTVLVPEGAQ